MRPLWLVGGVAVLIIATASSCGTGRLSSGSAAASAESARSQSASHSEIGVTMNTYAHVLPELRQEAADAIDELFGA
jgi:hypothetical protein